jgi:DNA polymerase-3 subunit epsilon
MEKRNKAIEWALQMCEQGALVLDTEATGGGREDEIFEIAVVRAVDGLVLFDQIYKPKRPVSWHSSRVHGFTTKDLKHFPKFTELWDELYSVIYGLPLLAFNSSFDKRLLQQTCDKYLLELEEPEWFCVMKKYGEYVGRKTGLSLAKVCKELQIPGGTHRAKEDALAAAGIVQKLAN